MFGFSSELRFCAALEAGIARVKAPAPIAFRKFLRVMLKPSIAIFSISLRVQPAVHITAMANRRYYNNELVILHLVYDTIGARTKAIEFLFGVEQLAAGRMWIVSERLYSFDELPLNPFRLSRYELLGPRFQLNLIHPCKISDPELLFEIVQAYTAGFF